MSRSLFLVLVVGVMFATAEEIELYSDKYDSIDVAAVLANDPLREQYYNCFMDTAPCLTDDAVFFKGNLPEAVVTQCLKCTNRQKDMFDLIGSWYVEHQEQKWNDLIAKCIEDAKKMKIAGAAK